MDWTENRQCVLCDKGDGNLLVCTDDGCPISVHKNCMGCEAHFDDAGNFHCPYCVYKQYTQEASQLRSKVMLTKKALSTFFEADVRDDKHQEPVVEMDNKEDEVSSKEKLVDDTNVVDLENRDEVPDTSVPENTNEVVNRSEGVHEVNDVNSCRMMVVYIPNSDHVSKRMKVDRQTENGECTFKVVDQAKKSKSADIWLTIEEQYTCKKRKTSVTFNMNGRKEEPIMSNIMFDRTKRGRVLWSEQEEEMLKEGVQRYSVLTKKNLPWKKILEFGRHVFDSSRTPSDLKDKWRKIAK
ncbi:putative transcription factor MYB-HB-like family [Helianthus annuus]|nr:putative transcription factor MYB-HB-like family [Helianthus annuus]KAJ0507867.1 putative transcription factor MYB-HB-like family [Helianthus annuus]KAJ0684273.1 putative transcription factor MYB-HB-like family [Helianthus annuus]KAJ0688226.1 putative transcription factor MYB-HB-like family [Helianthus annuus]KAJ0869298.1 putative transcription factor MYB-HB-like family [Helianthus annuus]